jgi:hypothetical protein
MWNVSFADQSMARVRVADGGEASRHGVEWNICQSHWQAAIKRRFSSVAFGRERTNLHRNEVESYEILQRTSDVAALSNAVMKPLVL